MKGDQKEQKVEPSAPGQKLGEGQLMKPGLAGCCCCWSSSLGPIRCFQRGCDDDEQEEGLRSQQEAALCSAEVHVHQD